MNNVNSPCGLKPIDTLIATDYEAKVRVFIIPASDASILFIYDGVKLTGDCGISGIPYITKCLDGAALLGTIVSIRNIYTKEEYIYRAPYYELEVTVLIDPFAEFEMQVNGTLTTSDIGKFANIIIANGDASVGVSHSQLDLSTLSDSTSLQLMILGLVERQGNALGLYSHVRVMISKHQLKGAAFINSDFWDRVLISGSDYKLTPHIANDIVEVSALTVLGKLNVGGMIDPIGVTVTPQATPPATDDGTYYYNSVSHKFNFKENGQWVAYLTDAQENLFDRQVEGFGFKLVQHNAIDNLDLSSAKGYLKIPAGTEAERPTPANGMARYNYTTGRIEFYESDGWQNYLTESSENFWDRSGTTLIQHNSGDNVDLSSSVGYLKFPSGTTAQQPSPTNGMSRYNTTTHQFEFYQDGSWVAYLTEAIDNLWDRSGTTLIQHNPGDNVDLSSSVGYIKVPSGLTGDRPTPSNGMFRLNTTTGRFEFYEGGTWNSYATESSIGSGYRDPLTITVDGQTSFTLAHTPLDSTKALTFLRGQKATYNVDFTITGTTLNWTGIALKTTDNPNFEVWYDISIGGVTASTDVTLGGATPSDSLVPTQKAAKTYIDNKTDGMPKFSMLCPTEINAMGNNSTYLIKYKDSSVNTTLNIGSYFNTSNHEFVSPYNCWVNYNMSLMLQMPAPGHSHTYLVCSLSIKDSSDNLKQIITLGNGNISSLTNSFNNLITIDGSSTVYMPTGYKARITVDMNGSTNDVGIVGYNPSSFYAFYSSSIHGDYGLGSLTATAFGGASIIGGALGLIYDDNRYVSYNAIGNADFRQKGAIRFKIIPYYSGAPSSYKAIISIGSSHLSSINEIDLFHVNSSGELLAKIYNSAGALIVDANFGIWLPSFGVQYEFELNIDINAGMTQLFIDGVQKGSIAPGTGTRSSNINLFYVGQWIFNQNMTSYFYIRDLVIFYDVQHTSDYTPGINPLSYLNGYFASQFSGEIIQIV